MAIAWGGYASINGAQFRAGVENTFSPANPTPSTTSVTVTTRIYLQIGSNNFGSGNGSWTAGDDASGSGNFSWSLSNGANRLVSTVTSTVTLIRGQAQSFRGRGTVRPFTTFSGTVTAAQTITIPARPVNRPAAPSGLSASRVSDARQNLSWTNNPNADAPYTNVEVWRAINNDGSTWTRIANLAGSVTSYADGSTRGDRRYLYYVMARNAAGTSPPSNDQDVRTTPVRPGAPTAAKTASGDIVVTRPTLALWATAWEVRDNGGAVLATRTAAQTNWTHTDPDQTQTHTYQVRAVASSVVGTLSSDWSPNSNTVQLLAPPSAPSNMAPSGGHDATEAVRFTWRHNPVDTTPQTAYEIRTRLAGASTWGSTGQVASTSSLRDFPADHWSNGEDREWSVRTWGAHADPGPWSSTRVLRLSSRPVAGIVRPFSTHNSSRVTLQWSYFDEEGTSQSAWETGLLDHLGRTIETRTGTGTPNAVIFRAVVDDGATYSVRVRVRDGASLWSQWESQTFTVTYARPPMPTTQAQSNPDGSATVWAEVADPRAGEVPVAEIRFYRLQDDGWVHIGSGPPGMAVVDPIPPLRDAVSYRAVAVSDLPSTTNGDHAVVNMRGAHAFINYGPGFGSVVKLWAQLRPATDTDREKELHFFDGRDRPVEYLGEAVSRTYQLAASLFGPWVNDRKGSSTWRELDQLARTPAPICVRDPSGTKLFVSVGKVALGNLTGAVQPVTIPLTEVDWDENVVDET